MKRSLLVLATVSITAIAAMLPCTSRASATSHKAGQLGCQICQVVDGGWTCQPVAPGGYGAPLCVATTSGQSCHLNGTCQAPGGGHGGFDDDDDDDIADTPPSTVAPRSTNRLTLNPETIERIAGLAPRIAMALAIVNREGGFAKGPSRMYLTPIELTQKDILAYLAPGDLPADYLKDIAVRSLSLNIEISKGQVSPVVYEIIPAAFRSNHPVIRVRVQQGSPTDPPYSELVLRFSLEDATRSAVGGSIKGAQAVQWELVGK